MLKFRLLPVTVAALMVFAATGASAQTLNLRDLLTNFLLEGVVLSPPPPTSGFPSHEAHFIGTDSLQFQALQQFNASLSQQLSSFPLPSSAGGFTYEYDPQLGVFNRASNSFGPVYAERANTIGRGKFNLGINASHFSFDHLDDLSLRDGDVRLVFTHVDVNRDGNSEVPFFEGDLITGQLFLKVDSDITAFVMTYGVTDRLDIGAAIPLVRVQIDAQSNLQLQRIATGQSSTIHQFLNGSRAETVSQSGSASGVGDVLLRAKYRLVQTPSAGLAIGGDLRLPTGEERDLLGTGATQVKALVIGSLTAGAFSPHVNAGYLWSSGGQQDIPNEIDYAAGFDWAVHPRMTLAVDVLGRDVLDSRSVSVEPVTFRANTNPDSTTAPVITTAQFPSLLTTVQDSNALSGSIGVKFNPFGNILITVNGLFALNNKGLQSDFSPLIGLDYSF
ncbi:MAG: transporter [Acidobacteriota bacterium]